MCRFWIILFDIAAPYWRNVGMTYISYANTYVAMVTNCLKELRKTKALSREQVYYKLQTYQEGNPLLKNLVPDLALFLALDQ